MKQCRIIRERIPLYVLSCKYTISSAAGHRLQIQLRPFKGCQKGLFLCGAYHATT